MDYLRKMFTITQRLPTSSSGYLYDIPAVHQKHPAEVDGMDLDGNDLGEGPSSLRRTVVSPGEVITSSREYMRSVRRHYEIWLQRFPILWVDSWLMAC